MKNHDRPEPRAPSPEPRAVRKYPDYIRFRSVLSDVPKRMLP